MAFVRLADDQTVEYARRSTAASELTFTLTGDVAPMIDFQLDPGQGIVCELSTVMQCDAQIEIRQWPGVSEQIRLLVNPAEAEETAIITVMARCAGAAGVFDLAKHGGRLLCPRSALLAAGPGVMLTVYSRYRNIGPGGLDLLQLEGNGWAFLRACGDIRQFKLEPGEQMRVNAEALAAMSATIDFDVLALEGEAGQIGFAGLTGPGQVWLQSGTLRA